MMWPFYLMALVAIVSTIRVVTNTNPIHALLSLIVSLLAVAGMFLIVGAPFAGALEIIVYAGAIITLLIFIIMFLNVKESNLPKEPYKNITIFVGSLALLPFNFLILRAFSKLPLAQQNVLSEGFGDIKPLGMNLFERWLLPFELISVLLLVALVGAVVFGRKEEEI